MTSSRDKMPADALAVLAEALHERPDCAERIRTALRDAGAAGLTVRQLLAAYEAGAAGAELAAEILPEPDAAFSLMHRVWNTLTAPERRALAILAQAERLH